MASSRVGGGRVADGGYDPVAQKQAYIEKANIVTDESLASTRRMVGLIEESKESAVGTMVQLDEQVKWNIWYIWYTPANSLYITRFVCHIMKPHGVGGCC